MGQRIVYSAIMRGALIEAVLGVVRVKVKGNSKVGKNGHVTFRDRKQDSEWAVHHVKGLPTSTRPNNKKSAKGVRVRVSLHISYQLISLLPGIAYGGGIEQSIEAPLEIYSLCIASVYYSSFPSWLTAAIHSR